MAVFKVDEVHDEQLDWTILREGGVCLYWRQEILTDEVNWLKSHEYRVISFDAVEWESTSEWELERRMHESFKTHLSFPDYYGMNLNALDECMQDDLVVPDSGGLVVVLNHFDLLHKLVHDQASDERSTAEVVLHIFAKAVRYNMLFGRRLLILVQSDNPNIGFGRLGGAVALWNHREWLNKNRGL